jgi:hypothetical protein
LAFPGATNTDVFETYVEEVLVPELKPGDVVTWPTILQTRCSASRLPSPGHVFEIVLAKAVGRAEPRRCAGIIRG